MIITRKFHHFPLDTAHLCCDCSEVGDNSRCCSCCGSHSLVNLANALNRTEPSQYEEEATLYRLEMNRGTVRA